MKFISRWLLHPMQRRQAREEHALWSQLSQGEEHVLLSSRSLFISCSFSADASEAGSSLPSCRGPLGLSFWECPMRGHVMCALQSHCLLLCGLRQVC